MNKGVTESLSEAIFVLSILPVLLLSTNTVQIFLGNLGNTGSSHYDIQ